MADESGVSGVAERSVDDELKHLKGEIYVYRIGFRHALRIIDRFLAEGSPAREQAVEDLLSSLVRHSVDAGTLIEEGSGSGGINPSESFLAGTDEALGKLKVELLAELSAGGQDQTSY